jgi:Mg/Co/Ni transporter MgtE
MREAISYEHTPRDVEQEFHQQSETAPDERTKAMQEAYAILQRLHEQGILELVKEALGSGEKVIQLMTSVMENGQVLRTVRNLKTLAKLIGTVEPETLEKIIAEFNRPKS